MNTDFISHLPLEISRLIFFDYVDETSRLKCIKLNKAINTSISSEQLRVHGIPPSKNSTPFSQLTSYYRDHCNFFLGKLHTGFGSDFQAKLLSGTCTTVIEVKRMIDEELTGIVESEKNTTRLDQIWSTYLYQIAFQPNNDISSKIFEKEVYHLLKAGVKPEVAQYTIQKALERNCSEGTILMLSEKCPDGTSPGNIRLAIEKDNSEDFILNMLEKCPQGSNPYHIRLAIEKRHSEDLILKLLVASPEGTDSYNIRLALERGYSESLMFNLIDKCPKGVGSYPIRLAIEESYSKDLVERLLTIYNPKSEDDQIGPYIIRIALEQKYSDDLVALLMSKVTKSKMLECLEILIKNGSNKHLIEKFLPEAEGVFDSSILGFISADNAYSEDVFIKVFNMSNQKDCIKVIGLSDVLEAYSENTAELLIDKGISISESMHIRMALAKKYPERIISKIIDRVENVKSEDIKTAKQMSYSGTLIKKMQAKCSDGCIIS